MTEKNEKQGDVKLHSKSQHSSALVDAALGATAGGAIGAGSAFGAIATGVAVGSVVPVEGTAIGIGAGFVVGLVLHH